MISFRSFSLVVSVVLLRQVALQIDSDAGLSADRATHPLNWLIAGCVCFCVIGKFLPVMAMFRADVVSRQIAWREMERRRHWLEWWWLVCQGWLITNTGAAQALADAEHRGWPAPLMILGWFTPTVLFLSALEFSFTQLECLWSRDGDVSSAAHWKRWWERVRLGGLGNIITCVTPVILLYAAIDIIGYAVPGLSDFGRAVCALLCLGLICLLFTPVWLKIWTGARSLPAASPVGRRVAYFCQQLGVREPSVCQVGIGHVWHGVALIGWTPWFRQIWIGPAVIEALSPEQLDMVLLHELAHLKRGHCWWRIVPVLTSGICCVMGLIAWPVDSTLVVGQVAVAGAFALSMIWMLGRISRQCELDADAYACQLAVRHCEWAAGQPSRAMTALADALVSLHDPNLDPSQAGWLHPSLTERLAVKP